MDSSQKRALCIWVSSFVVTPASAVIFAVLAGGVSQGLQSILTPDFGSLLSGVSGAMVAVWSGITVLLLGGLSGFALVHALGRYWRFGVGAFTLGASLLLLYPIWQLSVATLEFAGRRLWISTCGVWLVWDVGLAVLGCWMVAKPKTRSRFD